jgi:hypothetical protein
VVSTIQAAVVVLGARALTLLHGPMEDRVFRVQFWGKTTSGVGVAEVVMAMVVVQPVAVAARTFGHRCL